MRQMLGALLGCGWTVDAVLNLSFEQMQEVARCVYAHKIQMYELVMEPIAKGLGGKKGKNKRVSNTSSRTQADLKSSGLTPAERDQVLLERLGGLGFKA